MALTGYIKNGDKFEKIGVGVNIPVGMILPWFLNKDVPVGFIRVLDTWYDSATYPTLDAMYGDAYGRQNGKFRLPPVWDNRFLEGSNIAGTLKEAGLPNIEGTFDNSNGYYIASATSGFSNGTSGAFISTPLKGKDANWVNGSDSGGNWGGASLQTVTFKASDSNNIYGNSNTVQPKTITVVWIIKAFEGVSLSSTDIEITNLANEFIQFKADTDYVIDKGKSSDETIWYRRWKSGWLEQGGVVSSSSSSTVLKQVNLLKNFSNTNYNTYATLHNDNNSGWSLTVMTHAITQNGFSIRATNGSGGAVNESNIKINFYACGQGGND